MIERVRQVMICSGPRLEGLHPGLLPLRARRRPDTAFRRRSVLVVRYRAVANLLRIFSLNEVKYGNAEFVAREMDGAGLR